MLLRTAFGVGAGAVSGPTRESRETPQGIPLGSLGKMPSRRAEGGSRRGGSELRRNLEGKSSTSVGHVLRECSDEGLDFSELAGCVAEVRS